MNPAYIRLFRLAVVVLALTGAIRVATPADAQGTDLPGIWISNPKLAAKLALPVHFDEFSVQPPAGLEMTVHHSDQGASDVVTWSQPGANDSYGGLKLTVQNSGEANATDAVTDWLITLGQQSVDNLTHSDIQTGVLYGNTFARVYYKGPEHGGARIAHGFVYVGIAGSRMFVLELSDLEPRNAKTLPIDEAAAQTLTIAPTQSVQ